MAHWFLAKMKNYTNLIIEPEMPSKQVMSLDLEAY